jgi:hypothetical protein
MVAASAPHASVRPNQAPTSPEGVSENPGRDYVLASGEAERHRSPPRHVLSVFAGCLTSSLTSSLCAASLSFDRRQAKKYG